MGKVVDVEIRFWAKVNKTETCWLWTGYTRDDGYGTIQIDHWPVYVHRFSFELFKGKIADGLSVDHLCRVRNCVNPEHLEAVTMRENTLRGVSPIARQARQTHCKRGHELTGENLKLKGVNKTMRCCRKCEHLGYLRRKAS
jgi:hypothetical protein